MKDESGSFSRRYGFQEQNAGPLIYNEAPEQVRVGFLAILKDDMGISPTSMRDVVCGSLRCKPDHDNWSEFPNIWNEVQDLVYTSDWYKVYDVIEAFAKWLDSRGQIEKYAAAINNLLFEEGIGWQLNSVLLEVHGDGAFEDVVREAVQDLSLSGLITATAELNEARKDLSRRPEPDLSGAVHHAMGALECVAREATDSKATLGKIVQRNPGLIPRPVDDAVVNLWGFASDRARHVKEDRDLQFEEVLLVVGIAGAVCSYLSTKLPSN